MNADRYVAEETITIEQWDESRGLYIAGMRASLEGTAAADGKKRMIGKEVQNMVFLTAVGDGYDEDVPYHEATHIYMQITQDWA